jgi:hypothetical protein
MCSRLFFFCFKNNFISNVYNNEYIVLILLVLWRLPREARAQDHQDRCAKNSKSKHNKIKTQSIINKIVIQRCF